MRVTVNIDDRLPESATTRLLGSDSSEVIDDLGWAGFLRVVTNRRVFEVPASPAEVLTFMNAVVGSSGDRSVPGLPHGLAVLERTIAESGAQANLIPDDYLASVAIALACPVGTLDCDFRRFTGVSIEEPA